MSGAAEVVVTVLHGRERVSKALSMLVFGATGYVGTNLVPRLSAHGYHVRAAARDRSVLEGRCWPGVELIGADALDAATLGPALRGVDVAYYLVHSMAAGRDFGRLDLRAADLFAEAAARAGVKRIVYLGGLVPEDADSEHLISRREVGRRLASGSVPVTELRAGVIVGAGSAAFEVIRDLVNHLPIMVTPRWVQSRSPPIALDNLLEYLVRVPEIAETAGRVFDVAGPEMLSYEELMRGYGAVVGKRPRILHVPLLSPRLSSYWLGLVTAVPSNVARALIEGLRNDIRADSAALRALVPQRLLSYEEAVRAALQAERCHRVAARWVEGAWRFRGQRADHAFYAKRARGTATARASAAAVWRQVSAIGGENRYYCLGVLWTLREVMDWLVGGLGLKRGRRHPSEIRVGDTIDSWRVAGVEPQRRLTLLFGMKAPGSGVLEFELEPRGETQTAIAVTAYWHPAGVWGLLYWYAFTPVHALVFRSMARAIARRAEADR